MEKFPLKKEKVIWHKYYYSAYYVVYGSNEHFSSLLASLSCHAQGAHFLDDTEFGVEDFAAGASPGRKREQWVFTPMLGSECLLLEAVSLPPSSLMNDFTYSNIGI